MWYELPSQDMCILYHVRYLNECCFSPLFRAVKNSGGVLLCHKPYEWEETKRVRMKHLNVKFRRSERPNRHLHSLTLGRFRIRQECLEVRKVTSKSQGTMPSTRDIMSCKYSMLFLNVHRESQNLLGTIYQISSLRCLGRTSFCSCAKNHTTALPFYEDLFAFLLSKEICMALVTRCTNNSLCEISYLTHSAF